MEKIKSKDGTSIAFDRLGEGPALILVVGALGTRADFASANGPAGDLARHFTVYAFDRRGRGDSGDTQPYGVEREVEDIEALISQAGGKAFVYGHSSGAVLALEAARLLPGRITRLALYEPPFILDNSHPPMPANYVPHLQQLAAAGDQGGMVAYFMTTVMGMPAEMVAQMRAAPMWPGMEAVAPSLVYDALVMGDTQQGRPEPLQQWAGVKTPTLVMDGGEDPDFMHRAAEALAALLPNGQHLRLAGQSHGVASEVLTPTLVGFFKFEQEPSRFSRK